MGRVEMRVLVPIPMVHPFTGMQALMRGWIVQRGKTNATLEVLKTRIGTEGIKAGTQQDARIKSLFVTFFQPMHSLISIAKGCVDHGNFRSKRSAGVRTLL